MKSAKYGMEPAGAGSHPARGAWIEMTIAMPVAVESEVAPRKGCVD